MIAGPASATVHDRRAATNASYSWVGTDLSAVTARQQTGVSGNSAANSGAPVTTSLTNPRMLTPQLPLFHKLPPQLMQLTGPSARTTPSLHLSLPWALAATTHTRCCPPATNFAAPWLRSSTARMSRLGSAMACLLPSSLPALLSPALLRLLYSTLFSVMFP